jgi:hypothetical protein
MTVFAESKTDEELEEWVLFCLLKSWKIISGHVPDITKALRV